MTSKSPSPKMTPEQIQIVTSAEPSEKTIATVNATDLTLITNRITGSGKGVAFELLSSIGFQPIPSYMNRSYRSEKERLSGERKQVSPLAFIRMAEAGEIIEAEENNEGSVYATTVHDFILAARNKAKTVKDVDVRGLQNLRDKTGISTLKGIYPIPPVDDKYRKSEWEHRLLERDGETWMGSVLQLPEETNIVSRLHAALEEINLVRELNLAEDPNMLFVVNDDKTNFRDKVGSWAVCQEAVVRPSVDETESHLDAVYQRTKLILGY